MKQYIVSRL